MMDVYSSPPGQGPSRRWRRISRLRTLVGLLKLNLCRLRAIASSRVNHYQIFCDSCTRTDDYVSSYLIYIQTRQYEYITKWLQNHIHWRFYGAKKLWGLTGSGQ